MADYMPSEQTALSHYLLAEHTRYMRPVITVVMTPEGTHRTAVVVCDKCMVEFPDALVVKDQL